MAHSAVIPPPGQSSPAILRWRPRDSQGAPCRGRVSPRGGGGITGGRGGSTGVGGWRGRARRSPGGEQAQMREDLAHHGRVLHRGDEPQPSPAARAREHVDPESPVHQGGPGPGARAAGGSALRPARGRLLARRRSAKALDLRTPASMRRQDPGRIGARWEGVYPPCDTRAPSLPTFPLSSQRSSS